MIFLIIYCSIIVLGTFLLLLLFSELKKSKNHTEKIIATIYSPSELNLDTSTSGLSNNVLLGKSLKHLEFISNIENYISKTDRSLYSSQLSQEIYDCKHKAYKQVLNFSQSL